MRPGGVPVLRGVAVAAVALGLAVLSVVSVVDRTAERGVAAAGLPATGVFGTNIANVRAWNAYSAGRTTAARDIAVGILARQPTDPAAIRTLGFALLRGGDFPVGMALMRIAGGLGWRDVPTQLYWADAAVATGDAAIAAQRIDALLRTQAMDPAVTRRAVALEADPAGRAALADQLATGPVWTEAYLTEFGPVAADGLANRAALIEAAIARGVVLPAALLGTIEGGFMQRARPDLAYRLWRRAGPGAAGAAAGGVTDGGFERTARDAVWTPFTWSFPATGSVGVEIAAAPAPLRGQALHVTSSDAVAAGIVDQGLRLPPGRYGLSLRLSGARSAQPVLAAIQCLPSTAPLGVTTTRSTASAIVQAFAVPAGGACDTQKLVLTLAGAEGALGADLWIDDVAIVAEGGGPAR